MAVEPDSEALLAAARRGDDAAWRAIYRRLAPPLLGYFRGREAPDAEDLLGELFVQLVRDIPSFEGDWRAFRAWAFRLAHNRLVDALRYRARRPVDPVPAEALAGHAQDVRAAPPSSIADPSLTAALRRLPEQQRVVVLLRVVGELTVEEVARLLGKTPGAVKALQHRALATLRAEIERSVVTR